LQDAVGDGTGGAADIAALSVSNRKGGTVTFQLMFADRPALTSDDLVGLAIDADDDSSTGFRLGHKRGVDDVLVVGGHAATLVDLSGLTQELASSATRRFDGGVAVSIHRRDLMNTRRLKVAGVSSLESDEHAWDETAFEPFTLVLPLQKVVGARFPR
jgi:hypothetical protein